LLTLWNKRLRSTTLDSLHTGVSPGSIGWQYTQTTLGIFLK
jgi:hypothetical protein